MGELQKRIKEVDLGLDALNDHYLPKFLEIVEEARKEFPCYPKCSWTPMDTTTVELGKTEFAPCESCYQWREWFVKWFGVEGEGET